MKEKLEYIQDGRSGYIIYRDVGIVLKLYFEFGGGNCIVIIFTPSSKDWVNETGISLTERDNVLNSIAQQVIADRVAGGSYNLSEDFIEVFKKP